MLSIAYPFETGVIRRLAAIPEVREIFGKRSTDVIGGGRSAYTLPPVSTREIREAVREAHRWSIRFNYLLNGSDLGGVEMIRSGQRKIRKLLDQLSSLEVDTVTVANPLLQRLVTKRYPNLQTRVGVFARVAHPDNARRWEDLGAGMICVSAIACNRDFEMLARIREAVRCDLQLIVNSNCLPHCSHELTHMQLLTRSSSSNDPHRGFCLDYCFFDCSTRRLQDPSLYIKSPWIRPEDLVLYERLGYRNFKVVDRSSPGELLVRRASAYASRTFDGNLLELVAPSAVISSATGITQWRRLAMIRTMLRPRYVKVSSLRAAKDYGEDAVLTDYGREKCPVYISNKRLDGFVENLMRKGCNGHNCANCSYCDHVASETVELSPAYRERQLRRAALLESKMTDGSLWS